MLEIGTRVHCDYRHTNGFGINTPIGVVIDKNDPRIWTNTLAFRWTPTQEQVDAHIQRCLDKGISFDNEIAIDWGDGVYLWDDTKQVHPYHECPICLGK